MKKPLFSALYFLSLLSAGLTIRQAFAQRSPAVEPMIEVSIEDNKAMAKDSSSERGFDFANKTAVTKRIPANIANKSAGQNTPYSYIGPMIFLLALPFALWIVISKKMKSTDSLKKLDYYPKTFQFKPYKTDYGEQDLEDEDLPKAS